MAFAHGKIILFGEHAVVHGKPAIAGALDRGVTAEAQTSNEHALEIQPWHVLLRSSAISKEHESMWEAFFALIKTYETLAPVHISLHVDLPAGAGLGCSAAMGVAVVRAINALFKSDEPSHVVIERSLVWERVFHGNPSGIDSTLATLGGLLWFKKGEPAHALKVAQPFYFVVAHTGESSSTSKMVESVAHQVEREPERLMQIFDGMEAVVTHARRALETGVHAEVGRLMSLNQMLLNALLVSSARLEELCSVAKDAGALGAKLTGAGGGGCLIALAADAHHAQELCAALNVEAEHAFVTQLGGSL